MICSSGGGQTRALREVYHFISAQQKYSNQELSSKVIKLFPKGEHGQIFIGSLFEWNENMKRKKCLNK